MSDGPVQDLIDQLKLMRVELGEVKKRQITEERLDEVEDAMHHAIDRYDGIVQHIAEFVAIGARDGVSDLAETVRASTGKTEQKVDDAVRSLSEARREASATILARRRNVWLLMAFSALTGLATGALLSLVVFDHYLERGFQDTVGLMGLEWACTRHGGFVADQDNGKFCVFEISK